MDARERVWSYIGVGLIVLVTATTLATAVAILQPH